MSINQHLTNEQARQFCDEFGCDWDKGCANVEQLIRESDIDLEGEFFRKVTRGGRRRKATSFSGRNTSLVSPRLPIKHKLRKE